MEMQLVDQYKSASGMCVVTLKLSDLDSEKEADTQVFVDGIDAFSTVGALRQAYRKARILNRVVKWQHLDIFYARNMANAVPALRRHEILQAAQMPVEDYRITSIGQIYIRRRVREECALVQAQSIAYAGEFS